VATDVPRTGEWRTEGPGSMGQPALRTTTSVLACLTLAQVCLQRCQINLELGE
jgi:hypothetical protein